MTWAPMADITLSVGDRVVYPNQGLCLVSNVETQDIAGQRLVFVTLKREEDGAVVMVPESKVHSIGIRKVSGAKEVEKVFAFLRSESDKADLDWKQRSRTNVDKMATGGLLGLAEVVKGLQVLSELRPLPTKERELYDNARHLLVSEIAVALEVNESTAEDAVDVVLFPPGKERPKRTADEFRKPVTGEEDELSLDDEFSSIQESDLEHIPSEDEEVSPAEGQEEEVEEEEREIKPPKKAASKSAAGNKKKAKAPQKTAMKTAVAKKTPKAKAKATAKSKPLAKAKPARKK